MNNGLPPKMSPARLLGLIAYLSRPHTLTEASTEMHLSVSDINAALDYLRTVMVPGEPHIAAFEVEDAGDGRIRVAPAASLLSQPLKLTGPETSALLLTLETLEAMPEVKDPDVVRSAAAKIRRAGTRKAAVADTTPASIAGDGPDATSDRQEVMAAVEEALRDHKVLEVEYRNASDERSRRRLDPVRMMVVEDSPYLQAVDRADVGRAGAGAGSRSDDGGAPGRPAVKSFRIDRIVSATVADEFAGWHPSPELDASDPHGFGASPDHWVRVDIDADATWVADYDPVFFADEAEEVAERNAAKAGGGSAESVAQGGAESAGSGSAAGAAEPYPAWVPTANLDRTVGFLLRRWPHVRVDRSEPLHRAVVDRAKAGLHAYGVDPTENQISER